VGYVFPYSSQEFLAKSIILRNYSFVSVAMRRITEAVFLLTSNL
ncbi:20055_t:CDS:1, partial [Cetraspora pellucida]